MYRTSETNHDGRAIDYSKQTVHYNRIKQVNQYTQLKEKTVISNVKSKYEAPTKTNVSQINQINLQQIQQNQHTDHIVSQQNEQTSHKANYNVQRSKLSSISQFHRTKKSSVFIKVIQEGSQIYKMAQKKIPSYIHIHEYIIKVFDMSQAHLSNLAHVIIPFGFLLLEIFSLTRSKQTYVHKRFMQILKLLNNPSLQKQINSTLFRNVYLFFAQYQLKAQQQVTQMLFNFLNSQRNRMQAICPYYLNMFILIVNKNNIFIDRNANYHLEYTIQMEHPRYQGNFTVEDVKAEVERLNSALTNAYNSTQI